MHEHIAFFWHANPLYVVIAIDISHLFAQRHLSLSTFAGKLATPRSQSSCCSSYMCSAALWFVCLKL